jgi:phage tail protein X
MATYVTRDGDMLDAICQNFYGESLGYVEQVLFDNPGLAEYGPVLPLGVTIILPEIDPVAIEDSNTIKLWD